MVEVDALFKPTSASIRQLLGDLVGGFCLPAYQRAYRWMPADQRRLFEDLIAGLDRLVNDKSAVAFIGAIITVSGVSDKHVTVPADARQIIDGQQRLTTVLMICIATHEFLGNISPIVHGPGIDEETVSWLNDQIMEVQSALFSCLGQERVSGEEEFKFLPKLTRDIADIWSTRSSTARYLSPVANLLFTYAKYDGAGVFVPTKPTLHIHPEAVGCSAEDFEVFHRRFGQIRDLVKEVGIGRERDLAESIELDSVIGPHSVLLDSLFQGVTDSLAPALRAAAKIEENIANALRILLFSRFMLERMVLTQINAKDESYAFDLFDSLNTTGEPLTAFETFVPLVNQAEGDSYPTSPSYLDVSLSSRLIGSAADVQQQTQRMVTSFLLADAGLKVAHNHNDQRRQLTQRYRSAENIGQKRAMTRQLADSALSYFDFWPKAEFYRAPGIGEFKMSGECKFALHFLNKINHTIVVAPFSRYFAAWRSIPSETTKLNLEKIVLGMTSFSILWRAAHGGTDGIDGQYRKIMQTGVEGICGPLARTKSDSHDVNDLPAISQVFSGLRYLLSNASSCSFKDEKEWIALVRGRPVYEDQVELSKVLLLLSGHHAVAEGNSGLTKDGAISDSTDMLSENRYTSDDRLATIEHVAPQVDSANSWDVDIYANPATVNLLGNLTLLPLEDNSLISNRSWVEKRCLYRALSANAPDESQAALESGWANGLNLTTERGAYITERRQHLPLLQSVAGFEGIWDKSFIELRTDHLLSRAWAILNAWLEP